MVGRWGSRGGSSASKGQGMGWGAPMGRTLLAKPGWGRGLPPFQGIWGRSPPLPELLTVEETGGWDKPACAASQFGGALLGTPCHGRVSRTPSRASQASPWPPVRCSLGTQGLGGCGGGGWFCRMSPCHEVHLSRAPPQSLVLPPPRLGAPPLPEPPPGTGRTPHGPPNPPLTFSSGLLCSDPRF